MSIFSDFFKKEAPLLGLQGSGGGLGFLTGSSGGGGTATFTGGTVTQINISGQDYNLHTFYGPSNPATFTASGNNSPNGGAGGADGAIEIFLVGGGGGGSVLGGGGGGGGVAVYVMPTGIQPGSYTVSVGDGGAGEVGWNDQQSNGQPSYFQYGSPTQKVEVAGGGGGQSYSYSYPNNTSLNVNVANTGGGNYPGNNKGHWTYQSATNTVATPVGDFIRQSHHSGFIGGDGTTDCCPCRGGGGAGAGQAGVSARTGPTYRSGGANGGDGVQVNFDGNNYYWGGGGAADGYCMSTPEPMPSSYQGKGGRGGGGGAATPQLPGYGLGGGFSINSGGNGYTGPGDGPGAPGGSNSGGGGGSGSNGSGTISYTGGAGGSGIVMIRYKV